MIRRPPRSTRTDTLFPYATLFRAEISGGMARRVALARAVVLEPELVLYDEPFAGLDPISMGITAQLIRSLTDRLHCASVLITHDVAESFAIADQRSEEHTSELQSLMRI